jgi:hypothetical protein
MNTMPYLIKNTAGVWCVQRKVPERLQAAVARLNGSKKAAQAYLKRSLGTKDRREATRDYVWKTWVDEIVIVSNLAVA